MISSYQACSRQGRHNNIVMSEVTITVWMSSGKTCQCQVLQKHMRSQNPNHQHMILQCRYPTTCPSLSTSRLHNAHNHLQHTALQTCSHKTALLQIHAVLEKLLATLLVCHNAPHATAARWKEHLAPYHLQGEVHRLMWLTRYANKSLLCDS
jgi:hypothetical protein